MSETLFALTNDDAGGADPGRFDELLDFLDEQRVSATFFVVPHHGGTRIDEKPGWMARLRRALDAGHELQQHGFDHSDFEFGAAPDFMLHVKPASKARWERESEEIQKQHSLDVISARLAHGRSILEDALGYQPTGFRSPCLMMCDNTYQALADQGFEWSSNLVVNTTGWWWHLKPGRYSIDPTVFGEPWQPDVPLNPVGYKAGVTEVPMMAEYTHQVTPAHEEWHFQFARTEYDRVRARGGTFVTLSHYNTMTWEHATGLNVYRHLFEHARTTGDVRFVTVSQLVKSLPVA
jgi:peptidoglycan/xylan/chitin deacetylase (PgdA/CDA1 family)